MNVSKNTRSFTVATSGVSKSRLLLRDQAESLVIVDRLKSDMIQLKTAVVLVAFCEVKFMFIDIKLASLLFVCIRQLRKKINDEMMMKKYLHCKIIQDTSVIIEVKVTKEVFSCKSLLISSW